MVVVGCVCVYIRRGKNTLVTHLKGEAARLEEASEEECWIYIYTHMYTYIYICLYTSTYVYHIYIYIYKEGKQTLDPSSFPYLKGEAARVEEASEEGVVRR
jgi:hypothetical protein